MKILAQKKLLYIFLAVLPCSVNAGWFCPENYEDCVLEKMKGQDKSMISVARKACEKKFPFEKVLDVNQENKIKIDWFIDESHLYLEITENYGEYNVTRCEAVFSSLDNQNDNLTEDEKIDVFLNGCSDLPIDKKWTKFAFVFSNGKTSASVPADDTKQYDGMCIIQLWGRMRE